MSKPLTYAGWFEIAKTTRRFQAQRQRKYFDGVERAAALAAIQAPRVLDCQIDAMEYEFTRYHDRCPRWDGSIA